MHLHLVLNLCIILLYCMLVCSTLKKEVLYNSTQTREGTVDHCVLPRDERRSLREHAMAYERNSV